MICSHYFKVPHLKNISKTNGQTKKTMPKQTRGRSMKIFEEDHLLSRVPVLWFPNTLSPISTYLPPSIICSVLWFPNTLSPVSTHEDIQRGPLSIICSVLWLLYKSVELIFSNAWLNIGQRQQYYCSRVSSYNTLVVGTALNATVMVGEGCPAKRPAEGQLKEGHPAEERTRGVCWKGHWYFLW